MLHAYGRYVVCAADCSLVIVRIAIALALALVLVVLSGHDAPKTKSK